MSARPGRTPVLDEEHAAFIQQGVSVVVAARDADLVPDVARGCGCRVSPDRRQVTVLVDPDRAAALIGDIRSNGLVTVVFSQPSTHRTIQLKGSDARPTRVAPGDRAIVERTLAGWIAELTSIGYAPGLARAIHGGRPERLVAITFTPEAAFQQTPGPGAGARLGK
jgi:hypothetical protein